MTGGVGHTGGLTSPRPWRGRCRAGYSNTGGPPLPRKRAPLQKNPQLKTIYTKKEEPKMKSNQIKIHIYIHKIIKTIPIIKYIYFKLSINYSNFLCDILMNGKAEHYNCDHQTEKNTKYQLTCKNIDTTLLCLKNNKNGYNFKNHLRLPLAKITSITLNHSKLEYDILVIKPLRLLSHKVKDIINIMSSYKTITARRSNKVKTFKLEKIVTDDSLSSHIKIKLIRVQITKKQEKKPRYLRQSIYYNLLRPHKSQLEEMFP